MNKHNQLLNNIKSKQSSKIKNIIGLVISAAIGISLLIPSFMIATN